MGTPNFKVLDDTDGFFLSELVKYLDSLESHINSIFILFGTSFSSFAHLKQKCFFIPVFFKYNSLTIAATVWRHR